MASKIKVDQIEGSTASTITLPSGQTLDLSSGSLTLPDGAVDLSTAKVTGTLGTGNLPTIPVSKGGTGLTSLGTAGQVLAVNSGASALEFIASASGGGVLQAVWNANDTPVNTSSSSYVATNNSVTITPTANDSKILVILSGQVATNTNSTDPWIFTRPYRSIGGGAYSGVSDYRRYAPSAGTIHILEDVHHIFIDAPATTSAVTYNTHFYGNGTSIWFGGRSSGELSRTNAIAIELANGIA